MEGLRSSRPGGRQRLHLLSAFQYCDGAREVVLPLPAQRLLAYLALAQHKVDRLTAAEVLWPDAPAESARSSLRSALYRARLAAPSSLASGHGWLMLNPLVTVDVVQRRRLLCRPGLGADAGDVVTLRDLDLDAALLPAWDDPWLAPHRGRELELVRLARDTLAEALVRAGHLAEAIDTAMTSIIEDPLRERPYRTIAQAHLEGGDVAAAVRIYQHYRGVAQDELGVQPSPHFVALVERCFVPRVG